MTKMLHQTKKRICFVLIASLCFLSGCGFHIDNEIANWGNSTKMFDITFSLSKNIQFYMQNDKTTLSMPPRFEIDMTLTKDWDEADPFIDERLFYVTKDVDSLELNIIFQMMGESGLLEIADNNTDEVLWSNCWNSSVGNTSLAASLKSLQKEKEYVIRFTGTKIEYANIVAASESDLIKERTRPLDQTTEE